MAEALEQKIKELFREFGPGKKMVLSTSYLDQVTSRMMSIVVLDGCFYFQTDKSFRKYEQIKKNPAVALCIDNVQIEGLCYECGHPLENVEFCRLYEKCFKGSYDRYTALENERLFKIVPTYIQKWIYEDGKPFVEKYDFARNLYSKEEYGG